MTSIKEVTRSETERLLWRSDSPFKLVEEELTLALERYLYLAADLLADSGTQVSEVPAFFFDLKHNFFSALFLFSYYRTEINKDHRIFYAMVNQCLRGMVTGCDNLLDDEYKQTLPTNLPKAAVRFRSVLDIMASDRILFEMVLNGLAADELSYDQASRISAVSLRALLKSGIQEAGEEAGENTVLPPDQILTGIHHYKTGLLFQAPWAIPAILESVPTTVQEIVKKALYDIGMGCQIMDDMVDLRRDIRQRRHNYVLSTLYHASDSKIRQAVEDLRASDAPEEIEADLLNRFPLVRAKVLEEALQLLNGGLSSLLTETYEEFVHPATAFLVQRIGVPAVWCN